MEMRFVLSAAKLKYKTPLIIRKPESQTLQYPSALVGSSLSQSLCVIGEERWTLRHCCSVAKPTL